MKKKPIKDIRKYFNNILKNYNQNIRIDFYNCNCIKFNNGFILEDKKSINRMYRRLHFNELQYIKRFDEIYASHSSLKLLEKEIKNMRCSVGGKVCQEKHRDKIKQNLNTGVPWNKGIKGSIPWNKGKTKYTDKRLAKFSEERKGKDNPMWGVNHTNEYKKQASKHMKNLILKGKFTPNIHNSNTHWQSRIGNQKYRSSWEAMYHLINPHCKYETVRIKYNFEGKDRIYIIDFEDIINKKIIEIKPSSHKDNSKMKAKEKYAIEWCKKNGYIFEIITEEYLLKRFDIIDLKMLDKNSRKNLEKLYETYKKKKN